MTARMTSWLWGQRPVTIRPGANAPMARCRSHGGTPSSYVCWLVNLSWTLNKYTALVNCHIDPENHQSLMETSLPTPTTARVYVNIPEGNIYIYTYIYTHHKPISEIGVWNQASYGAPPCGNKSWMGWYIGMISGLCVYKYVYIYIYIYNYMVPPPKIYHFWPTFLKSCGLGWYI